MVKEIWPVIWDPISTHLLFKIIYHRRRNMRDIQHLIGRLMFILQNGPPLTLLFNTKLY